MDALHHETASPPGREGNAVQFCHKCGCPFPNRRPNAKHRRAHKKVCVKVGGFQLIGAEPGRFSGNEHLYRRTPGVDSEPESVVEEELKRTVLVEHDIGGPMAMAEKPVVAPLKSQYLVDLMVEQRKLQEALHEVDASRPDPLPALGQKNIRTPICCIVGGVRNGKTKLINCISGGNIQESKAGVRTRQISATYVGEEIIRGRTKELIANAKLNVPGLLLIDTPGHESFTTLRFRSIDLCDIAILVVDIRRGLQPQVIELLKLLKTHNTKFLVALTNIDRIYGWKECLNVPIEKVLEQQSETVHDIFNGRLTEIIREFKEQGMNAELYYENNAIWETLSIVPTSAISGEGVADLLQLLVQLAQKTMVEKQSNQNKVRCTVLEVKVFEGHGIVIDVVLVNGVLREGDQIVICSMQGPIITNVEALLMPHSMKELEVKGTYKLHKEIKAPMCMKIVAQGLEPVVPGTQLYVVGPDDDLEDIKDAVMEDMRSVMNIIDRKGVGVYLQASTIGSLEALIESLKSSSMHFPVSGIGIGPVHNKNVLEAAFSLGNKRDSAIILALDVRVMSEAQELANELGVKIFSAVFIDYLFHLLRYFMDSQKLKPKEGVEHAVFPCVLRTKYFSKEKDAYFVVVDVIDGIAKIGTPLCIPIKGFFRLGRIASLEVDHKSVDHAKKGQKAVMKIDCDNREGFESPLEMEDDLVSRISRRSIKALKDHYYGVEGAMSSDEWRLIARLIQVFRLV